MLKANDNSTDPLEAKLFRRIKSANDSAEALFLTGKARFAALTPEHFFAMHLRLAEKGRSPHSRAEAYYKLGICHRQGFGTPQNRETALENFRKAAEMGHASAHFCLFLMESYVRHLSAAAQAGHIFARLLAHQRSIEI